MNTHTFIYIGLGPVFSEFYISMLTTYKLDASVIDICFEYIY
jgi:hypothetical protein